jgi:hypothetical protein
VTNINICNKYIDSVKLRVELVDRYLVKRSDEYKRATMEQRSELQKMEDSLRKLLNENKIGIPEVVNPY